MHAASMPHFRRAQNLWFGISIVLAVLVASAVLLGVDAGPGAGSGPVAQSDPAQIAPFRWG